MSIAHMIADGFTFYNELDMLLYRLSVLDDIVDYFIILEATKTHAGKDKILYYE
jgi:beta-1,4-mannosyl-glycoprotein beta-1,4-N-acetylglucosaminyltransferase